MQPAAQTDPNSQAVAQQQPQGAVKPLDYFLMAIGQFLQQTSPKDIIDLVKTLKGGTGRQHNGSRPGYSRI